MKIKIKHFRKYRLSDFNEHVTLLKNSYFVFCC